jgi:glycosyltransferase involved in cell wall biosynthesis
VKVALHTDQLWFSAPGGIGTYIRELRRAFDDLPEPPEVLTFQVAHDGEGATGGTDVEVPGSIRALYPAWALTARPGLPTALAPCDVVHATNHAAVPPAGRGQGLVAMVHDLAFDIVPETFPTTWRWQYRLGVRAAVRRGHVVLVPSTVTRDDLVARYGADPDRIAVTPLASALPRSAGDPAELQRRLGIAPPYLVFPGTLEPRKNAVRLIRAYRQVAPEIPHSLVLAGPEGWGAAEVREELARPGPGNAVVTGWLGAEDLDTLYRGADAVAYPSLYEGFGLPILEAMQRGVPVVTSTTPACAETAGDAALLVEPDDVAALADALARILGDDALRGDLRARGLARADAFSWDATARATLHAYRVAVERAR